MVILGTVETKRAFFNVSTISDSSRRFKICVLDTKAAKIQSKKTRMKGENVLINIYIDGDEAELLTALADHDGVTIEEYANEIFSNLLATIWKDIKADFLN